LSKAGPDSGRSKASAQSDAATLGLDVYMVGGAVRDAMLGRPAGDRDWVVVGATPEQMAARGFVPVGGDFPVFLHPVTKEEYALARTERKSGRGYKGFTFHTGADVTLEDDLRRRDLTINAMARSPDGRLVDPWGGQDDVRRKVLRHVGPAFAEDPVRLLRLARFAARFPEFSVADETLGLARRLVADGEVDALVPERVWQEVAKGLMTTGPGRMFQVLQEVGALARVAPGLVFTDDVGSRLAIAAQRGLGLAARFGVLCHLSPVPGAVGEAWRAPSECRRHAELLPRVLAGANGGSPADWLALIEASDALRKPQRFLDLVDAAACVQDVDIEAWRLRVQAVRAIDAGAIARTVQGQPERIRRALGEARLAALTNLR
jgi:tRNA nucleotidyltransferase (CCA-adding enzyme)